MKNTIFKLTEHVYYFSLLVLLILYLFPGSLIGYLLYGNLGQQPNLILETKEENNRENKFQNFEKESLKDRKFLLTSEEEKLHKEFIKKIKNPLWNQYK